MPPHGRHALVQIETFKVSHNIIVSRTGRQTGKC